MLYPRRTTIVAWTLLGHPRRGLETTGTRLFVRDDEDDPTPERQKAAGTTSSIIVGVIFCLFLVAIAGLGVFYFFKRKRQRAGDIESTKPEKRNWWMVEGADEKKGGIVEWWRQSHSIPDRVEPPPSANVHVQRSSLQRLRSALTRKGAMQSHTRQDSSGDRTALLSKIMGKATSPTSTIVLPMQTVPQPKPRYPSVLERGYRVPLYPIISPPKDNSPPRSLTSPAPPGTPGSRLVPHSAQPISVTALAVRKKLAPPPRVLKISNGRPLVPISERKMGHPRSPAHRQRKGLMNQFKHPFLPLKDSDTAFPRISSPRPSVESSRTNPKLGYAHSLSKPRPAPLAPGGPRQLSRESTRRVPAPIYETKPSRPLLPATPLHMREDVRVLPPGLSPTVRPNPTPI